MRIKQKSHGKAKWENVVPYSNSEVPHLCPTVGAGKTKATSVGHQTAMQYLTTPLLRSPAVRTQLIVRSHRLNRVHIHSSPLQSFLCRRVRVSSRSNSLVMTHNPFLWDQIKSPPSPVRRRRRRRWWPITTWWGRREAVHLGTAVERACATFTPRRMLSKSFQSVVHVTSSKRLASPRFRHAAPHPTKA